MLARTLFVLLFIAMLGGAIVHAAASLHVAAIRRLAGIAAENAFATAEFDLYLDIAGAIASGADPRVIGSFIQPVPAACVLTTGAGVCELTALTTFTPTTTQQIGNSLETTGSSCAPLCAVNAQENDAVSEGRISARITVTISGQNGTVFAVRERYAAFRTMRIAPYAMLAGTRDATSGTIANGAIEGDDAGGSFTTINVLYKNANTGVSISGNAWQSRAWNDADAGASNWDP